MTTEATTPRTRLQRLEALTQPIVLLLVRLTYGFLFTQTGLGKLNHLDRTTDFFTGLGVPLPAFTARAVGVTELVGGALLMLGLGTRFAAVALTGVLLGALASAHRDAFSEGLSAVASADPFPFLVAVVVLVAFGGGRWSVEALIARWRSRIHGAPALPATP